MGCGIPIAESHDWIYTSVGVHPHDAAKVESRHYSLIEDMASNPRVLAIGETGLTGVYVASAVGAESQAAGIVALVAFLVGLLISNSIVTVVSTGDHELLIATVVGGKLRQPDARPYVHVRKNGLRY